MASTPFPLPSPTPETGPEATSEVGPAVGGALRLRTATLFLLVLALAACGARGAAEGVAPTEPSPGTPVAEADQRPAEDLLRQGTVEEEYDGNLDVRSWRLLPLNVTGAPFTPGIEREGRELRMGAIAMRTGPEHPLTPNQSRIQLVFMGVSDGWLYEEDADTFHLTVGSGAPVELPVTSYRESPGQGYVIESMGVPIPTELFLRLARASSAEGRLGPTSFTLGTEELARFRAFVDQLPPEVLGAVTG